MESSLVFVTLVSLAMAASLSVVVWRLLRDERRRSDARVAALARLAAETPEDAPRSARSAAPSLAAAAPRRAIADPLDLPLNLEPARASRLAPRASAVPLSASRPPLSAPRSSSPAWGRRLVIMLMLALGGATIVLFALTMQARAGAHRVAEAAAASPALELLALQDARDGATLTISGTVRNPSGGSLLKRVTITAIAFDGSGGYLATGRALLDVTSLAAGDASSFVVTITPGDNVARYRIAFRAEDGHVIAHTDRRQTGPVAESTAAALDVRGTP